MEEDIIKLYERFSNKLIYCYQNKPQYISDDFNRWLDFNPFISTQIFMDTSSGSWKKVDMSGVQLRECASLGYFVRCAEEATAQLKEYDNLNLNKRLLEILQNKEPKFDKLKKIVDFFNTHDKIGLGEPVRQFVLFPFDYLVKIFQFTLLDFCKQTNINPTDSDIRECIWQMASHGYLFKTAEKIYESFKKEQMIEVDSKKEKVESNFSLDALSNEQKLKIVQGHEAMKIQANLEGRTVKDIMEERVKTALYKMIAQKNGMNYEDIVMRAVAERRPVGEIVEEHLSAAKPKTVK